MRIISGTAGSIAIKVPAAVARPTTDRVREAVFSIIGEAVEDARVLDLFAGSGAMGLEALSRGAREALFIERDFGACRVIEDNLNRAKLSGGRVTKAEAFASLRRLGESGARFNLIFADPPYAKKQGDPDHGRELLASPNIHGMLEPGGVLVLETMVTKHDSSAIAGWEVIRDRAYGSTRILILQNPPILHAEGSCAADLQPAAPSGIAGDGSGSMEENAPARRKSV
jgi:16S rRNA (guanine966-N2)-methyltransferase